MPFQEEPAELALLLIPPLSDYSGAWVVVRFQVPSERWRQGAAMFDDNTMLVYGGYSQRCGDYCDDVWSFDLRDNTWMEIYPLGHFAEGEVFGVRGNPRKRERS